MESGCDGRVSPPHHGCRQQLVAWLSQATRQTLCCLPSYLLPILRLCQCHSAVAAASSPAPLQIPESQLLPPAICPSDAGESHGAGPCQAPQTPAHQPYNLDINERRELKVAVGLLCAFDSAPRSLRERYADGGWQAGLRHCLWKTQANTVDLHLSILAVKGFYKPS